MANGHAFTTRKRRGFRILAGILLWLWAGVAGAQGGIPGGLPIAERFSPGIGAAVGEVRLIQGTVAVVHAEDDGVGYPLSNGDSIFRGDTIYTGDDGKVNIELTDGSRITLATGTAMAIDRSIYNPERLKTRSSFVRVVFGKARFLVRKISGLVSSEFNVKTKTAIVGVRGSDFAVEATETRTRVTAFEDTQIDVIGLVVPCPRSEERKDLNDCQVTPTVVRDFEQALVALGDFPRLIGELAPEQIDAIKGEFSIDAASGLMTERVEEPEIRVAEGDLSDLDVGSPRVSEETAIPDVFAFGDPSGSGGEEADAAAADVAEDRAEEILDVELERLPGFPDAPR